MNGIAVGLEETVFRCKVCGNVWDEDGCRLTVVPGVSYQVEEFVCKACESGWMDVNV